MVQVVLLFNMVPVASFFLAFGNAAGAALWAADVEVPNFALLCCACFSALH